MEEKKHLLILGGGISGLASAFFLQERFPKQLQITLIEAQERLGGWVQSEQSGPFLIEKGPRGFRPKGLGLNTLSLCQKLGLTNELLPAEKKAKKRFLWINGKLEKLPSSPLSLLSSPLMKGACKSLLNELHSPSGKKHDESIYSFFRRRLPEDICQNIIDPFVSGIYAGDMHQLSVQSCFPTLANLDELYGSLIKGAFKKKKSPKPPKDLRSPLLSFKEGMHTLIKALEKAFCGDKHCNAKAIKIEKVDRSFLVHTEKGTFKADHLLSCLPLPQLAKLFPPFFPKAPYLPFQGLQLVHLGFEREISIPQGFGFLIPKRENLPYLGMVWDSKVFPEQQKEKHTLLSCFLPEDSLYPEEIARQALLQQLNCEEEPDHISITHASKAIGQFPIGFNKELANYKASLEKFFPNLHLLGASINGPAINQCVTHAKEFSENFQL